MLSRAEMEAVIRNGGAVLYNSCIITNPDALPTQAEIAAADPSQRPASLDDLEAQRKALDAQIAALKVVKPEK